MRFLSSCLVTLLVGALAACSGNGTTGSGGTAPAGATTSSGSTSGASDSTSTEAGTGSGGGQAVSAGTLIGDFMGVNAFVDDPLDKLAAIGNVREYHDWAWCEGNGEASYPGYPDNQNSFVLWNGFWDFDKYYDGLKAAGVFGFPVIQSGVTWLNANGVVPAPPNADRTAPSSYVAHADHLFQYAARYGRTKVADNLLKLAADQKRLTGLDTLHYIEDFNEQDATWTLPNQQITFTSTEYAAMASADYDGDQMRMGATVGVKNADPTMKHVMGGLAGSGTGPVAWEKSVEAYLDGIRAWSAAHRGGSFPADVVNVHYYSFGPDGFGVANPRPGLSPEEDKVEDTMKLLVQYRDQHLPGKELWITEFGYDTDSSSRLRAPAIGKNSADIVQGQWIVRYYLALLEAGLDRAFLFMLRDGCEGASCHTQFDTCGLTTVKDKWAPKASYFFVATVRNRLASFALQGAVSSGNPDVRITKLKDTKSGKEAYVLWAPTSKDTIVAGYDLEVGEAKAVTQVSLADQQMTGVETPLTAASGKVKVDVTETPTILLVDKGP